MGRTSLCRHIFADGTRCEACNITGDRFCYWHRDLKRRHSELHPDLAKVVDNIPKQQKSPAYLKREALTAEYYGLKTIAPDDLNFPALEDADSIQIALSLVLNALAQNSIDLKRAGRLLSGLNIASSNVRRLTRLKEYAVRNLVYDETGSPLAPEDPTPSGPLNTTPEPLTTDH